MSCFNNLCNGWYTRLIFCFLAIGVFVRDSSGADGKIEFDPPVIVHCRDVTPENFASENPESKIVEVRLNISALFNGGSDRNIETIKYTLFGKSKKFTVVDFIPKTELATGVDGNIQIIEGIDAGANMSVDVGYGFSKAGANASLNANHQRTYKKLAPKDLLVASGTINRQRGVFYKLKRNPQITLEGQREFCCMILVPKNWRGTAATFKANAFTTAGDICGTEDAHIALIIDGDREAKEIARKFEAAYDMISEAEEEIKKSIVQSSGSGESNDSSDLVKYGTVTAATTTAAPALGTGVALFATPAVVAWLGYKYFTEDTPPEDKADPQIRVFFEDPRFKKATEQYEKAIADLESLSGSY